jgi:peptide/nickel transport system permease protein
MSFLVRRFSHSVILLFGVSILSFLFLQLAPGNFFDEMRLNPQISRQTVVALYTQYGMDKPFAVRYWLWLKSVSKGDWGVSFAYNTRVAPLIWARSGNTVLLTGAAALLSWIVALPAGVLSAAASQRHRWVDYVSGLVTTSLLVTPDLLLAIGVLWFAIHTHWFRAGGAFSPELADHGAWSSLKDRALHLTGPLLVLVLGSLPILLSHIRAAMLDALKLPCIRSAQAHGISTFRILFRHALPACAAPLIILFGFSLGSLLSASLLIELVMSWPGLGPLLLEAILARDVYLVIGAIMFSAMFLAGGIFLADVLLFIVDPRIRTENLA